MQAATGVRFDATINERMHDESGKAIDALKRVGEIGNFHYVDNLARALKHTGRILIDLIPKYYDTRRVLTILREDGTEEQVMVDPNAPKPYQQSEDPSAKVRKIYNPRVGDYDVAVTIGPSYATKRAEASDSMIDFIRVVPNAAPLIGDLIAKNLDWPGAAEISERLQTMLPPVIQQEQIKNLPPEMRGLVANLQQQLQGAQQQLQHATAMLGDKDKDRAIKQDQVDKQYEVGMTNIASQMQQAIMKTLADNENRMNAQIAEIVRAVGDISHKVDSHQRDTVVKLASRALDHAEHKDEMNMRSKELSASNAANAANAAPESNDTETEPQNA
jgi:hypothetical protein